MVMAEGRNLGEGDLHASTRVSARLTWQQKTATASQVKKETGSFGKREEDRSVMVATLGDFDLLCFALPRDAIHKPVFLGDPA